MSEKRRRGRPRRISAEAATVRVVFWITPAERAALRRMAGAEHQPIGQVVRDAVNEYVADSGNDLIFRGRKISGRSILESVEHG